jgi:hydroxymethylpyrimidine/phosphomethylpyrimidine kinase
MPKPHRRRTHHQPLPVALTIAGSDSGGGAGIQADLKTFMALGVHGASAITCLTAQNPKGVRAIQAASPNMVRQQIAAIFAELPPRAVKTGMLFTTGIIRAVAEFFHPAKHPPLIVDPVMVATSGAQLLKPMAIAAVRNELLPLATLITPNVDEAALLLENEIGSVEDLRSAAKVIYRQWGCAALVKGGHLRGLRAAVDLYYDGQTELLLEAPRVIGISTHGTGCAYSAAIAGYLALGQDLPRAVQSAKQFITNAIVQGQRAGNHFVLNWRAKF